MNTRNVNEIFIGDGAALTAGAVNIASLTGQLSFVNQTMVTPNATTTTISVSPDLYVVNKLANGDLKRSFPIKGTSVSSYKGESYTPAKREVWSIGYNRLSLAGAIEVNNSTIYSFTIRFKWDKQFFSERPETFRGTIVSSASATQLSIATQIANAINGSAYGSQPSGIKVIKSVVVGNGTGAYGLTGASAYGVEMWALDVNQFANTTYKPLRVYFSAHVDDASGFGTTTSCTQIQANSYGTGTLEQVYGLENFNYQFEGVLNRTKWPIPTLAYLTATALTTSGTLAAFTSATTIGLDHVIFSATASTQLPAGSQVVLDGVAYEIKYYLTTTLGAGGTETAILTSVETTTNATGVVNGKAGYDMINIGIDDVTTGAGANVGMFAKKMITIASPAINSTATSMLTASTGTAAILAFFGTNYMASTPLAPLCSATTINGVTI
jgi:hypothetical protein